MYEKKRFLVKTVFEKAKNEIPRGKKSSIASYLSSLFEEQYGFEREERAYVRYYKNLVEENRDYNIDDLALDYLSKYIGYDNFEDFCERVENDDLKTFTLSFKDLSEKIHQIIITVTPTVLLPDFIKKNGLGILEMTFVLLLVTGGVVFSNNKSSNPIRFLSEKGFSIDKPFMYWDGDRYMATDSSSLGPQIDVIPMDKFRFKYFKKITRPDTLNATNSMGKVWYDKTNNNVEFFTSYGKHPINDKALKDVSERILNHYAGYQQSDSIEVE
ncbi:hypothetical protein [Chryseobacterium geocarposphaerae]|uniref:Uncharacterized protein n=1 Tax=Chryseobacterium geocarposphaerae TaxID=1416776 RepID=A0A2M9C2L0_9FLAO|nr:hypothetical protein [Chryseobacterium geocarposphaerae]PJJ64637.1 hypothetical protein CLV73_3002 [Chryseobacterium geocarposphaerae]